MAECGDFVKSTDQGSDFLYEFVCSPCAEEGSILEAYKFCQECDKFLCSTCTRYHRRFTEDHKLVEPASAKTLKARKPKTGGRRVNTAIKCPVHKDRVIEMFCGTHDMVYCLMCIANDHG